MALRYNLKTGSCNTCGCQSANSQITPDFSIKRHDTRPSFRVSIEDCNGPFDFRGLIVEINMWSSAKLKTDLSESADYFSVADNIGFNQIMVGDIIIVDQVRSPEKMLVLGFDEKNKFIKVQRSYHGTDANSYKKGTKIRIFRIMNEQARVEMDFKDVENVDGTLENDVIQSSFLTYDWKPEDTCLPGIYYLEFKVLKMIDVVYFIPEGDWVGEVFKNNEDGFFYTGSVNSNSSVKLEYNQVNDKYFLKQIPWSGEIHLHSDNQYYTGENHDDGSVLLITDKSDKSNSYNNNGILNSQNVSITPSFTNPSMTPEDFGCFIGEGVEWVRRFPSNNEGFIVQIVDSFTTEV